MSLMTDQLQPGARVKVFWYGAARSSKGIAGLDNWYDAIVLLPPVTRVIEGNPIKIVVLMDLAYDPSAHTSVAWVDVLLEEHYGADPAGGKMWHFADEPFSLDFNPKTPVTSEHVAAYLETRKKAWLHFPSAFSVLESPGSLYKLLLDAKSAPSTSFLLTPSSNTVAVAVRETEDFVVTQVKTQLQRSVYIDGLAAEHCKTRDCTRCTYLIGQGFKEDPKKADAKSLSKGSILGVYIPIVILADRSYLCSVMRGTSSTAPSNFNGYSICTSCKNEVTVPCIRIEGQHKYCIICTNNTSGAEGVCSACNQDKNTKDKFLGFVLKPVENMFPHYKVRLQEIPRRITDAATNAAIILDYSFEAQFYDVDRWRKVMFVFELDQEAHNNYSFEEERARLVAIYAEFLSKGYARVIVVRVNHKGSAFGYPPGVGEDPPLTAERFVVMRHWVLYFLINMKQLPETVLLYLFYPYQARYSEKFDKGKAPSEVEKDLEKPSLTPLWDHPATGFAWASPPVVPGSKGFGGSESSGISELRPLQDRWHYYLSPGEWKMCNTTDNSTCRRVGRLEVLFDHMGYFPFPMGLSASIQMPPAVWRKLREASNKRPKVG